MRVTETLRLLRPKQWAKGLLVFAALLFTRSWTDAALLQKALLAFASISLFSSAVYVLNDLKDVERDRQHPVKKNRPLASGTVPTGVALVMALSCLLGGSLLIVPLGAPSMTLVGTYLAIQIAYNVGVKHVPVLDVFVLSSGFVLRAALGATAISVTISGWLLFCTGALALLLGFGKRRHEFVLQGSLRAASRESLGAYTKEALDALVIVAASVAALCYGLYALESPTAARYPGLFGTTAFVFYGIARYVFLIFGKGEGGEPENVMLGDRHLVVTVIGFVIVAVLAMNGVGIPFLEMRQR